jgi:hypothetical protein
MPQKGGAEKSSDQAANPSTSRRAAITQVFGVGLFSGVRHRSAFFTA